MAEQERENVNRQIKNVFAFSSGSSESVNVSNVAPSLSNWFFGFAVHLLSICSGLRLENCIFLFHWQFKCDTIVDILINV